MSMVVVAWVALSILWVVGNVCILVWIDKIMAVDFERNMANVGHVHHILLTTRSTIYGY